MDEIIQNSSLDANEIANLLTPFGVELSADQMNQVRLYLSLLLRWNEKVNLTAIRDPRECVTRHFGESMLLAVCETVKGRLLDIGSGAGFPALPLKILLPDVEMTLLEPTGKKRAFLKEVVRACELTGVAIKPDRLEDLNPGEAYNAITMRAVGVEWVEAALMHLSPSGKHYLWLSRPQIPQLEGRCKTVSRRRIIEIPGSRERVIWVGDREGST